MNVHGHAELALLNVEYAAADFDLLIGLDGGKFSSKQVAFVGSQLASAKHSLKIVLDVLESPDSTWTTDWPLSSRTRAAPV